MTESMYFVLLSLREKMHGYGIMEKINKLSNGRINMGAGTLYGLLTKMSKEKLIVLVEEVDRKKIYCITEKGKDALMAEYRRLQQLVTAGECLEDIL